MPAKDLYHDAVRNALIRDGWTITHDPYTIPYGVDKVYVDLGGERTLAAERGTEQIAVEIKSFLGASGVRDFEQALGQYVFYRSLLARVDPERQLFLAVPVEAYDVTFSKSITEPAIQDCKVALVVFDPPRQEILRWMP